MTAQVIAYSEHPEDDHLTLAIECQKCGTTFGRRMDTPAANERLEDLADRHNIDHHGHRRIL